MLHSNVTTDEAKMFRLLGELAAKHNLELVVHHYHDGSGAKITFQAHDSFDTAHDYLWSRLHQSCADTYARIKADIEK